MSSQQIATRQQRHALPARETSWERYMGVLLGAGVQIWELSSWCCMADCHCGANRSFGGAGERRNTHRHHHDSSVNTSKTKGSIGHQKKGADSLKCSISSANSIRKLNWFCIAGCEIIATQSPPPSPSPPLYPTKTSTNAPIKNRI